MMRRRGWSLTVGALLVLACHPGCDCGGAVSADAADGAFDAPPDLSAEADADADAAAEAEADVPTDWAGDADADAPGDVPWDLADTWPDAPVSCDWYQLRSTWDTPCDGSGDSWLFDGFYEPGDEPILRVVSVAGVEPGAEPPGTITVRLRRTYRPVVIALGSYDPVTWIIERDEGARLDRVYVYGYETQTVVGADDVPVVNHSPDGRYPGYCYPFCGGGDTRADIAAIEAEVGLPVRSFDGCGQATGITLGDVCREECRTSVACAGRACGLVPECGFECGACAAGQRCDGWSCTSCTPSCAGRACGPDGCGGSCGACPDDRLCDGSGACVAEMTFPGCGHVAAESHYCITTSDGGRPALLGLDTGTVCPFGKPDVNLGESGPEKCSIGWVDGALFICVDRPGLHGLVRYDVLADTLAVAPVPCGGVVDWRGGLITAEYMSWHPPDHLDHFVSFDDALDGAGERWSWGTWGTRMTAHGDLLYSAWHSTNEIDVQSLPTGSAERTIPLEGYDTWITGLSVTDDGLLVLNATFPEGRVAVFEEATGAWLYDVHPSASVGPLVCFVGP